MPAPGMDWVKICFSNESECGFSVAVMLASSSRAANTELGEAVTIKSSRVRSFTYSHIPLGNPTASKSHGEGLPRRGLEYQSFQL